MGGAAGVVLAGREDWHFPSLSPRCLDRVSCYVELVCPEFLTCYSWGSVVTLFLDGELISSSQDPFPGSNDRLVIQTGLSISGRALSPWLHTLCRVLVSPLTAGTPVTQARNSILEEEKARGTGSWDRLLCEKVLSQRLYHWLLPA